jgi:hypothetical protein
VHFRENYTLTSTPAQEAFLNGQRQSIGRFGVARHLARIIQYEQANVA